MKFLSKINLKVLRELEELHKWAIVVLFFVPLLCVVNQVIIGLFLGISIAVSFLLNETIAEWMKKKTDEKVFIASYLVNLIAICVIAGRICQLFLYQYFPGSLLMFSLVHLFSVYILRKFVKEKKKGQSENVFLRRFEVSGKYVIFVFCIGVLRALLGNLLVSINLLAGGYLLVSFLLFIWSLTKSMQEEFTRLSRYALCMGLALLVLDGFVGLF